MTLDEAQRGWSSLRHWLAFLRSLRRQSHRAESVCQLRPGAQGRHRRTRIRHFQVVHHDLWDYDIPCPPNLVTVTHRWAAPLMPWRRSQRSANLSSSIAKTGKPLFPVGRAAVSGEHRPGRAGARARSRCRVVPRRSPDRLLTADLLTRRTPEAHAWAAAELAKMHNGGPFTPLRQSARTRSCFPGFDGGAEWGGSAYDPASGRLLRQRQRPGLDRGARARRRRHRRPERLLGVMRQLSPRRSPRHAAADPGAHQPHAVGRTAPRR